MTTAADEVTSWTAASMAAAVRRGSISSVELVEAHIARMESLDGTINAIAIPDAELAMSQARAADRRRPRRDPEGRLHGVPFTVKECLEVRGLPLCEGSRLRRPRRPDRDAVAIARLRGAGAILLGKTNLSELASFPDTTNLVYGATRNPYDSTRSVSGSSGGEAAAIAARISPLGVGTDYGGSIRGPAHATGIVGLRPGRGTVPLRGSAPARLPPGQASWSTVGPMARTVEDVALSLSVMRGDVATSEPVPLLDADPPRRLTVIRDAAGRPLAPECRDAVTRAAAALAAAGHQVDEARPPRQADLERMFDEVSTVESWFTIGSLLSGSRWAVSESLDPGARLGRFGLARAEAELSPQLRLQWSAVRDRRLDLEGYLEALVLRADLECEIDVWLEHRPILLAPVAASPAYPLGALEMEIGGRMMSIFELYSSCTFASALGLPAVAVPAASTAEELPVAVQVIGSRGREPEVLAVAREIEQALGGYSPPPG